MRIEISADPQIDSRVSLIDRVYSLVEKSVGRHADRVSEVSVHLGDESGDDVYCAMEVRLRGKRSRAVTHHARGVERALVGAARDLHRFLESGTGRFVSA